MVIGKHSSPNERKRILGRRVGATLGSAIIAGALIMPSMAFAAEYIEVEGSEGYASYYEAAAGAGWSWDGADDMVLDGYNGGGIFAYGNLNVELNGENTLETDGDDGIYVSGGDLTITDADGDGGSLTVTGEEYWGDGAITATAWNDEGGNITIDGATVDVTVTDEDGGSVAIQGAKSVTIQNGATVNASGNNAGIVSTAISIADSTVTATGSGSEGSGLLAESYVYDSGQNSADATIVIDNSTVKASGGFAAILAVGVGGSVGSITITNADILTPDGGKVLSFKVLLDEDVDPDDLRPTEDGYYAAGQYIGTGEDNVTTFEALEEQAASDVVIAPQEEPAPEPEPADDTTPASTRTAGPSTGDPTSMAMMGLIGALGIGLVVASRIRRRTE